MKATESTTNTSKVASVLCIGSSLLLWQKLKFLVWVLVRAVNPSFMGLTELGSLQYSAQLGFKASDYMRKKRTKENMTSVHKIKFYRWRTFKSRISTVRRIRIQRSGLRGSRVGMLGERIFMTGWINHVVGWEEREMNREAEGIKNTLSAIVYFSEGT